MANKSALVFGIIFLVVGVLGFFSNPLLGVFDVDTLHSVIHVVFGLILVVVGTKSSSAAATTLVWVGVIYLLLAVVGFLQGDTVLGIIPVNSADNWLHLVLGAVILLLGWSGKKEVSVASAPQV
ncbi:MAG: hypothetical protein RL536_40 [Candidatus Parcubacteria bacterium]|jgi:hypothetical protein